MKVFNCYHLLFVFFVVFPYSFHCDDKTAQEINGRSAKPDANPFLNKLVESVFGGNSKVGRPAGPVYKPPRQNLYGPPPSTGYGSQPQRPHRPIRRPQPPSHGNLYRPNSNAGSLPISQAASGSSLSSSTENWSVGQPSNMPRIKDMQVQCETNLMRVKVEFDRPFYGMVFSKGHYRNPSCVHVPAGLGQTSATFDIALNKCGMSSSSSNSYGSPTPQGSFIENTIIVQYDPQLQEVWDQVRKLRCTWYDFYEKSVTFSPLAVESLDPITANFLGDNLRCWMQIQVGKGPHSNEVSGIVKIGQTMTMVLGVKDDENKFDMMVRNCVAHDGVRPSIQLVDEVGCVTRPKIMSPFQKVETSDSSANVIAYAYFQAFKFPDSMNVHFECVVQVCRGKCPQTQCDGSGSGQESYESPLQSDSNYGINPRNPAATDNDDNIPVYQSNESKNFNRIIPGESTRTTFNKSFINEIPFKRIQLTEPGYESFSSRKGIATSAVGGRPRALKLELKSDQPSLETENNVVEIVKRETRGAELEGNLKTQKVIQVLAPTDIQFALDKEDKEDEEEEVIVNVSPQSSANHQRVCVDTTIFIGIAVLFLMILVIALITIIFLWIRIKSMDRKLLI